MSNEFSDNITKYALIQPLIPDIGLIPLTNHIVPQHQNV